MYYGDAPLPSLSHVPSWVDDIVRHYLPHDWRVVWHVVVPREGETVSGCCRLDDHIIECFVSSSERKTCNEYLILHEIAHALRGI